MLYAHQKEKKRRKEKKMLLNFEPVTMYNVTNAVDHLTGFFLKTH